MRHLHLESLEPRRLLAIDAAIDAAVVIQDPLPLPRAPADDLCTIAHPGDANCDRVFDSSDLVLMMQSAEYQDDIDGNSVWSDGDFDGDGDFTSSDLVMAFQTGSYEKSEAVDDGDLACHSKEAGKIPLFGGLLVYLRGRTDASNNQGEFATAWDDLIDSVARCRAAIEDVQHEV